MTLVKHSARTLRKGCKSCKSTELYWYHDSEGNAGSHYCNEHKSYNWTLVNVDGSRHDCKVSAAHVMSESIEPWEAELLAAATEVAPVTETVTPVDSEQLQALQALQTLFGGKQAVDRDEVTAIVKGIVDALVFPTRTVIVRDEVKRTVEGNTHTQLADVTTAVLAGEHVMMVGPAGTGKSTIAEQAAEALGLESYSISLSPQTPASAFLGYMDATGNYVRTLFRESYENGGLFHFDEVDNAHPSVLAVINAALANGRMAFPDGMVKRSADFRAVASANTYGRGATRQYVGRQAIDAATLDRFTVLTIEIDEALETALCNATGATEDTVARVLIEVRLMRRKADENGLSVVLSPRATVGMCKLLTAGMSWDAAIDARVRRGLDDSTWRKLQP